MIRVTGGEFCGRRLKTVRGTQSRPTLSRVREAVFNILGARVVSSRFADLFAGGGSMGIEALSRGAGEVTFVERDPGCRRVLRDNLRALGLERRAAIVALDAFRWLDGPGKAIDILFADPPYGAGLAARVLSKAGKAGGASILYVIIQHGPREILPDREGSLVKFRSRRYGETVVDFYEPEASGQGAEPAARERGRPAS